jgi:hypothetical protein
MAEFRTVAACRARKGAERCMRTALEIHCRTAENLERAAVNAEAVGFDASGIRHAVALENLKIRYLRSWLGDPGPAFRLPR